MENCGMICRFVTTKGDEEMKGFTMQLGKKDVFIETSRKNKTENLASEIIRKLNGKIGRDVPDNPNARKEVLYYLQKAECEIKTLSNGKQYYEICGNNFGGKGSFVDDGMTIIIHLDT